jgi:hypothetical protein
MPHLVGFLVPSDEPTALNTASSVLTVHLSSNLLLQTYRKHG